MRTRLANAAKRDGVLSKPSLSSKIIYLTLNLLQALPLYAIPEPAAPGALERRKLAVRPHLIHVLCFFFQKRNEATNGIL